jgi:para-nitrobenzyl esterase
VNTSFGTPKVGVAEDCLFLNIYTPTTSTAKRPVMVWFHGGGYTGGQGGDYDGRPFVKNHDAIVVTVNYRRGVFGFLATSGLSATESSHTSGNYGIEDQQAALQWIHDNIAEFGGDPKRVTITGQSAGAGSVCFQTVAPKSKGLFSAAILMSGNCAYRATPTPNLQQSESAGDSFAASIGCVGTDAVAAACLRSKPVGELLKAAGGSSTGGATALPLGPIVDGEFVPKDPGILISTGHFNRVPIPGTPQ